MEVFGRRLDDHGFRLDSQHRNSSPIERSKPSIDRGAVVSSKGAVALERTVGVIDLVSTKSGRPKRGNDGVDLVQDRDVLGSIDQQRAYATASKVAAHAS
jgi:hypothetical protein